MFTRGSLGWLARLALAGAVVAGGLRLAGNWRQRMISRRYAGVAPTRVVILGAGFGGLAAARELAPVVRESPDFEVVVIDRRNFHLFTPLLYQVATGNVEPGSITYPAREIARDRGFYFRESQVRGIDLPNRRVLLDDGTIDYDYLILALGSVSNFFGMTDVAQNAMPLKSVADALYVHNRLIDRFEEAAIEPDESRRQQLLTTVIAGGGATGVELAASLSDVMHGALLPAYPMIDPSHVRLILVEAKERILAEWHPNVARMANERLREMGVEIWVNAAVARAWDGGIELRDGRVVPAGVVVWTAGIRPSPVVEELPVERGRGGFVAVEPDLRVRGQDRVFAVGDLALCIDPNTARPVPWNAPAAIAEGAHAAKNVLRLVVGEQTEEFRYRSKGDLLSLGRWSAAADLFGMTFNGFPAWLVRRTIYLANLVSFKNRLTVLIDWAFALSGRPNTARVDLEPSRAAMERPRVTTPAGSSTRRHTSSGEVA